MKIYDVVIESSRTDDGDRTPVKQSIKVLANSDNAAFAKAKRYLNKIYGVPLKHRLIWCTLVKEFKEVI